MFDLDKINDIDYLKTRCDELIVFYIPVVNYGAIERTRCIMDNMQTEQEARQYIFWLISRLQSYHLEHLTWDKKIMYLPLIKESIKKYLKRVDLK